MLPWRLSVSEQALERPLRHDHVECDLEDAEHGGGEDERGKERLPRLDAPHHDHEARDEEEARDIEAEPLRDRHIEEGREEHLQHAPELVARDEGLRRLAALAKLQDQAEEAGAGEDHRDPEGEVACRGPGRLPRDAGAPVVEGHQQREREERREGDNLDRALLGDGGRIVARLLGIPRDDLDARVAHFATKPASVMRLLLRLSSSSRNLTMSLPAYHTGFNACFSM